MAVLTTTLEVCAQTQIQGMVSLGATRVNRSMHILFRPYVALHVFLQLSMTSLTSVAVM